MGADRTQIGIERTRVYTTGRKERKNLEKTQVDLCSYVLYIIYVYLIYTGRLEAFYSLMSDDCDNNNYERFHVT